jgi:dipeptidase E
MVFLTSSGFSNHKVWSLITQYFGRPVSNACIITTGAVPLKEKSPYCIKILESLKGYGIPNVAVIDIEFENPQLLRQYDLVVLMGGNSKHLFSELKKSQCDKVILENIADGRILVGISAGAMFLSSGNSHCKYIDPILNIDQEFPCDFDHSGLKITNHWILPHIDRFRDLNPNLETELRRIEVAEKIVITRMKNGDFVFVNGNGLVQEYSKEHDNHRPD